MHAGNGQLHQKEKSRQLQRRLYLAAKKSRNRRFHALYDRIFRPDVLWRAWEEVKANGGSAGVDGVRLEEVERRGVALFLEAIAGDLKAGRYKPQPVLRVYIPKPDGRQRPLGIPTVRDRVVQQACRIVIEPIFEANFQDHSYGFRPKRSAAQAVRAVDKVLKRGWWVVDADIQGYFDAIDHDLLLTLVKRRVSDRRVLKLLCQWLKAGVMEEGQWRATELGSPQGGVISPLMANLNMTRMIKLRHQQPSLWHRGLAEDIEDLWEPWMRLVNELLEDEQLLDTVYEAQGQRHPQSRSRGRMQTPAEVLLRLLLLKHIRNWSYDVLEREVRANLVYRAFTRIGDEKVPDAKTLARLGQLIGPKVIEQLHQRVVELAQEQGVTRGRKLRVDTTVVETNIHYPTDSSLLGDGTRVLTRTMKKIERKSGGLKRKVRDRMRSVGKRVLAIALSTRLLGPPGEERRKRQYRELLSLTRKIVNQAQRVLQEVQEAPRRRRTPLEGLAQSLQTMVGRVRQVVKQTRIRIFAGVTKSPGKIVSVFEPHTEIIRKGKASKPTEFGKLVKIQEAENQIVTHFEVFAERPPDSTLLLPSIQVHQQRLGRVPRLVAADAGFYSRENEKAAQALGVHRMSVPNKKTKSGERKLLQRQGWFRSGQKWRTGSEGRISVLKRRHGLRRCLDPGLDGMRRWVGLGVIADNVIQIGCYLVRQST